MQDIFAPWSQYETTMSYPPHENTQRFLASRAPTNSSVCSSTSLNIHHYSRHPSALIALTLAASLHSSGPGREWPRGSSYPGLHRRSWAWNTNSSGHLEHKTQKETHKHNAVSHMDSFSLLKDHLFLAHWPYFTIITTWVLYTNMV